MKSKTSSSSSRPSGNPSSSSFSSGGGRGSCGGRPLANIPQQHCHHGQPAGGGISSLSTTTTGGSSLLHHHTNFSKLKNRSANEFDPQKYERPGMKQEEILALKKIFDACDVEGSGSIQLRDVKTRLQNAGYESKSEVIGDMISYLDRDGRTVLTFPQFLDLLATDDSPFRTREDISRTFNQFDPEGTGYITLRGLMKTAKELNMSTSAGANPDISEILTRCDTNGDGKISELEFHAVMDKQTFP
ncbi:ef hand domain-containing protein [Cystoisospora suis]|uniref:Ef hand domain-containing protein n=1 Tax=Cystoisospora suis TaxID=483139 RepID=A0A2C6L5X4_9APIC|nr:ef hand domain-containing protein [Cystoisospora suis]